MDDCRGGVVAVDTVGEARRGGNYRASAAHLVDQSRPAGAVDPAEPQYHGGDAGAAQTAVEEFLCLADDAAREPAGFRRRAFINPAAAGVAVNGRRRNKQDPADTCPGRQDRVQHVRQTVHVGSPVGILSRGIRGNRDDDGGGVRRDGRQLTGAQVSGDPFDGGRKFLRRPAPPHHAVACSRETQPGLGAQIAATGQQYSHRASLPAFGKPYGQA
ncbi:hypothetical protein SRABI26_04626 [Arthrobacter sp. Bi26]|nr:hypothetical protein SRABI26_04626 [Arthrobacter sp. Bi26]